MPDIDLFELLFYSRGSLLIWAGLIVLVVLYIRSPVREVKNVNLSNYKRYEILSKITNQRQLTNIAMTSSWLDLEETVTEKIDKPAYLKKLAKRAVDPDVRAAALKKGFDQFVHDEELCFEVIKPLSLRSAEKVMEKISEPTLLKRLAAEAVDPFVRAAALEKGFDQLIHDKELCFEVVKALPKKADAYRDKSELLLKIASVHPNIIRQFWKEISSVTHVDKERGTHADKGTKFVHLDQRNGWGGHTDNSASAYGDCAHYDHSDTYSHKDQADPYGFLQRFPPAAKE